MLVLVGAMACSEAPRPENPGLWTLLDARALYEGGAGPDKALATEAGIPGGIPLGGMLEDDGVTLTVRRAARRTVSVSTIVSGVPERNAAGIPASVASALSGPAPPS